MTPPATSPLPKNTDVTDRIEAYGATATTESIDFAFTDGNIHRVGLYVADYDNKKRSEEIQIIDTVTGRGLDTEFVSGFKKGEYLFWDLSGSVQIRITRLAGQSAVFSGIFFDPIPGDANVLTGLDTTTTGLNWRNNYGSQGEDVIGDTASTLPSYVTSLTAPTATVAILKAQTTAPQSLQRVLDMTHGIEAYWESSTSFDITMDVSNSGFHQVTLYLADYDHKRRAERIEVVNPANGLVLESQDFFNFTKGVFANFNIPGSAIFRVIPKTGASAVVSGIFFDGSPGSQVRFTGTDNTTQGNWKAAGYGATFSEVVGDSFTASNSNLSESGGTQEILHPLTNDPRSFAENRKQHRKRSHRVLFVHNHLHDVVARFRRQPATPHRGSTSWTSKNSIETNPSRSPIQQPMLCSPSSGFRISRTENICSTMSADRLTSPSSPDRCLTPCSAASSRIDAERCRLAGFHRAHRLEIPQPPRSLARRLSPLHIFDVPANNPFPLLS